MKERRSRHSYRRRKGRFSSTPPPLNRNRNYKDVKDRSKRNSVPDEKPTTRNSNGCSDYQEKLFGEHVRDYVCM